MLLPKQRIAPTSVTAQIWPQPVAAAVNADPLTSVGELRITGGSTTVGPLVPQHTSVRAASAVMPHVRFDAEPLWIDAKRGADWTGSGVALHGGPTELQETRSGTTPSWERLASPQQ